MSKIRTYEDLLQEEQRLLQQLKGQEILLRQDITSMKENLQPVTRVFNNVSKAFTRDNASPLANFGLEFGLDLVLRKFVLARAGWFLKIVVPYLVKNYSSHIIGEEKRALYLQKIQGFFNKLRPKAEQPAPAPTAASSGSRL